MKTKNELRSRVLKKMADDKKITWRGVEKSKGEALAHTYAECWG